MGTTLTRRSLRLHVGAGVAIASTGILVSSLIAAPPDPRALTIEHRGVQFAAVVLPLGATLRELVAEAGSPGTVPLVVPAPARSATEITPTDGTARPISDTTVSPATDVEDTDTASQAALDSDDNAIPDEIMAFLGPLILFAPIILIVILACPPCALINFVTGLIESIIIELTPVPAAAALPSSGTPAAAADATTVPAPPDDPVERRRPVPSKNDADPMAETDEAATDVSVTPSESPTRSEEEVPAQPTVEIEVPEKLSPKSETADDPEPVKRRVRPVTSRPAERESLEGDREIRRSARRDGTEPSTTSTDTDDHATKAGRSDGASGDADPE
jgi:hypothetical protein